LSIGESTELAKILGFDNWVIYDATLPEVDILDLPFADSTYAAVVSDQVLEHVAGSPRRAIEECWRVLKPGGFMLHTSCFVNEYHGAPGDFWRFSPEGLMMLMDGLAGVRILDCGGWGNGYALLFMACGLRSVPIPDNRYHPAHWIATYNDKRFPIFTWILAQKEK
jgi:SAM-dependent methyltransferase